MKKWITGLLVSFSSLVFAQNSNLDPTQIYTTGNVVSNTPQGGPTPWVNGVYQNSLTCWSWGDPGYCGPNPIVRPGNNINFSYGLTNLYQIQSIANILPNSGTGLRVNGYNFGFTAKNGNGWDDGRTDTLSAYVSFYDSKGSVTFNKNYDLNYKFDWTTFNYSENFTTPFATKDLSNVQYGFVGRDNNFWAGPYGPEITNVSFSLKYSVDPCFSNVLSSPSCPGYMDALAKLVPQSTTTTAADTTSSQSTNTIIQPNAPITQIATSSTSTINTNNPTTTSNSITVSSSNTKETTTNSNGLSIGLSVVAKNQQREQSIAMQAAQNAIAAADQASQQSQQDALSVAQTSSSNSINNPSNPANRINGAAQQRQDTTITQSATSSQQLISMGQPNFQQNSYRFVDTFKINSTNVVQDATSNQTSQIGTTQNQNNIQTESIYSLLPPQQSFQQPATQQSISAAQPTLYTTLNNQSVLNISTDLQNMDSQKMLLDRSNPIFQALENKNIETQNNMNTLQGAVVNRNAQNNEIAGGVDITKIAQAPAGYGDYLNFTLKDAAFYAPKEVYKNQKNVDNVRVLRSLSSDRLHQELINSQYERK